MKRWYIIKLWRTSPLLALAILAFCGLQVFFMVKRIHNFPFFIYDMYSRPVQEPQKVTVPVVYINGNLMDHTRLPNWKEGAINGLLKTYVSLKEGEGIPGKAYRRRFGDRFPEIRSRITPQSDEIDKFPEWMTGFLSKCYSLEVTSYRLGYRTYRVEKRQISNKDYVDEISLAWPP